jgi:hypothetical protein
MFQSLQPSHHTTESAPGFVPQPSPGHCSSSRLPLVRLTTQRLLSCSGQPPAPAPGQEATLGRVDVF